MYRFVVLSCFIYAVVSNDPESRTIKLSQGVVRGYKDPNEDIFVFYSIPYATAPTGPGRFKAPLPAPKRLEPLDAVDQGIICPQINAFGVIPPNKVMMEDCLIASIYVPDTNEKNLPVVVYVHGGGYILGYGDLTTPKKLVSTKKVIAVTFNYRLGPHGFLCLGTKDAPGNAGMKDQVALLRWVKANIENFGGNPHDVTIEGCSAGSSSVGLLMISKMAKGLFNKVIPSCGGITSPYNTQLDPIDNAKEYAKLLNYDNVDDIFALEQFYKTASYELLHSANIVFRTDNTFLMSPCVELDIGEERFLEEDPLSILKKGDFRKLPMLYGFANMEGLFRIEIFDQWKEKMNTVFEEFLPPDLQFSNEEVRDAVIKNIKKFYFNDKPVDEENVLNYVNYFTDTVFACPILRNIQLLLEAGNDNVYLYEYSYVDDSTPFVLHTKVKGANHCAQTVVLSDGINMTHVDESGISPGFKKWKNTLREIWLNFITKGKPWSPEIPEWLPVRDNGTPYMALKQIPELGESLLKDRCFFWEEIYNNHYKKPIPPSPRSLPSRIEL